MSEDIGAREPAEPGTAAEPAEHNQVPGAAAPSYWYDRHLDLPPDVDSATPHAVAVAERPQRGGLRRTTLILGATAVLALGAGFGGGLLSAHTSAAGGPTATDTSLTQQSAANPVSADVSTSTDSVEKAASTVLPSVVSILATSGNSAGEGSGVILTANGLILTNNHVVDEATTLTVRFDDGTTATATVVGTDAADDIAVIRAENLSGLTPATLGTSADLQVGEAVVAIGAPLGLSSSVTSGIVSALHPSGANLFGRQPADRDVDRFDAQRDPDRRGDQPRQLRRPTGRPQWQGHRHQLGHRVAVDVVQPVRQHRRRLCHPDRPGRSHRPGTHQQRHGHDSDPRRRRHR